MDTFLASLTQSQFSRTDLPVPSPSCCPFHPHHSPHWWKHGSYERSGPGQSRIYVPRWLCKIIRRTFSILPDSYLPYQRHTTEEILRWMYSAVVLERGATATARTFSVPLITVRRIRLKFRKAVKILRLPGHAGALDPAAFLRRLLALGIDALAELFAKWKQLEPKHSLVGMHPR